MKSKNKPDVQSAANPQTENREKNSKRNIIIAVIAAVVLVLIAVGIFIGIRTVENKTNQTIVAGDIERYTSLAQNVYGGDESMERRTFGDASEALAAFVSAFNTYCEQGTDMAYRLSYTEGSSFARGKSDPWGKDYYVTAKATNTSVSMSTYSFYIISAGKNQSFNEVGLVLDGDDVSGKLLVGITTVSNLNNNNIFEDIENNFGVDDIVDNKGSETTTDPEDTTANLPKKVTITFNPMGGDGGTANEIIKNGIDLKSINIEIPERDNYAFEGYYTELNGEGVKYFDANGIGVGTAAFENDLILYAHWSGVTVNVRLDNDGGYGSDMLSATYGSKMPNVTVPTKSGYTFIGYYSSPDGVGTQYYNSNGRSVTKSDIGRETTLYAYWAAQSYSVEHYVMGTDGTYPASPEYTEKLANRNGVEIYLPSLVDTSLLVPNGIVFSYATLDGTRATTVTIDKSTSVVRIYYMRCTYSVSLSKGDEVKSVSGAGTYCYGARVIIDAKTEDAYSWFGWIDLADDSVVSNQYRYTFEMPTKNVSLEASANNEMFVITLDANGGYCGTSQMVVSYGEYFSERLPSAYRNGYQFGGWSYEQDGDPIDQSMTYELEHNTTLYAIWTSTEPLITLDVQGGVDGQRNIYIAYGEALPSIGELPTKEGYVFSGYYTAPYGRGTQYYNVEGEPIVSDSNIVYGVTLYACWLPDSVTLEYYDRNEEDFTGHHSYGAPTVVPFGETTELGVAVKDGFEFIGWYLDAGCTNRALSVTPTDPAVTVIKLYAKWSNAPTIRINYWDEGELNFTGVLDPESATRIVAGETVKLYEPTKKGYDFLGWYSDAKCKNQITSLTASDEGAVEIDVYAKWRIHTYTVNYYDENGALFTGSFAEGVTAPKYMDYGDTESLPTPTRTGYTFKGWYSDPECKNRIYKVTADATADPIKVYAKWSADVYSISYRNEGDSWFSGSHGKDYPTTVTFDAPAVLVEPTRGGYNFMGWFLDKDCTVPVTQIALTEVPKNGVVYVYAKWEAKTYDIVYKDMYGEDFTGTHDAKQPMTIAYGESKQLLDPTRAGYTFLGWYTSPDCTYNTRAYSVAPNTATESPVVYYAKWQGNQVSINYRDQNDEKFSGSLSWGYPTNFRFGETVTLPTPTRTGYTFGGWYLDAECTIGVTELSVSDPAMTSVSVYALWTAETTE